MPVHKIINDPVYGFITIDDELIFKIIAHPYYQRLRRIQQMAMAHLVYPGAVHTRLHHSLGAYHLMCIALQELTRKGVEITQQEQQAAKIAILLHDVGHGPYSHALEQVLAEGVHHEKISLLIIEELNKIYDGKLQMALEIFNDTYHKKFLHQLVSGQLDVDRMDYLTRDSFFSGVIEGYVAYDRILKMITVYNGELMIEEKGIYSIEKFLIARRLMYRQVYLHKTVVSAEQMLQRIIKRAKHINALCQEPLNSFINTPLQNVTLEQFCCLDDADVMMAIKTWCTHTDKILALLCNGILNRKLLKVKYFSEFINESFLNQKQVEASEKLNISIEEATWLVFAGEATSSTYDFDNTPINILYKDGSIKNVSEVDDALINESLRGNIKKYYICYPSL
ncbi:MAG: HD domain-containing protein [Ferruginibacter sp.]|nr:HD domain-containing protein [Ferruginibacter sp.]